MKSVGIAVFVLLSLLVAVSAPAAVIVSYTSGVSAASGQTGAEDPTDQGWTWVNLAGNGWCVGVDSGDGGWRTVDATSSDYSYYSKALSTDEQNAMDADGWQMSWTLSMDSDADNGSSFVDDYYLPPNNSRQGNCAMWIERNDYVYILTLNADSNGNLLINDGTTQHQITTGGSNGGYDVFKDYVLKYDGSDATLTVDGSDFSISSVGTGGSNRILFGNTGSATQGSGIWNEIELIPEPASIGLIGLMGLIYLLRRKLIKG